MSDLTDKVLNIASETIQFADQFMVALEKLVSLEKERANSNNPITLSEFDAVIAAAGGTKHTTGSQIQDVLSNAITITSAMDTAFQTNIFNAVRP